MVPCAARPVDTHAIEGPFRRHVFGAEWTIRPGNLVFGDAYLFAAPTRPVFQVGDFETAGWVDSIMVETHLAYLRWIAYHKKSIKINES